MGNCIPEAPYGIKALNEPFIVIPLHMEFFDFSLMEFFTLEFSEKNFSTIW